MSAAFTFFVPPTAPTRHCKSVTNPPLSTNRRLRPFVTLAQHSSLPSPPTNQTQPSPVSTVAPPQEDPPVPAVPTIAPTGDPPPIPEDDDDHDRLFSNLVERPDGTLVRPPVSEVACTALVAGTMIGAGVLALPTVATPVGFVPASTALLATWVYMVATGLLISEVTISTACAEGRSTGISPLSLATRTLGPAGTVVTAVSYVMLHYAILTAYTTQGGAMFFHLLSELHVLPEAASSLTSGGHGALLHGLGFAGAIGGSMYALPRRAVDAANNIMVAGAFVALAGVLLGGASQFEPMRLVADLRWHEALVGELPAVLLVSCVYHNIVSSITMRLEGSRRRVRRVVVAGSGIPIAMFIVYTAAVLGGGGDGVNAGDAAIATAAFSSLAIATSFVGFVDGLTDFFADARASLLPARSGAKGARLRWVDFAGTIAPPVVAAAAWPDGFLKALDVAGTYGIAVLFGAVPAIMAWRTRRQNASKRFEHFVPGGDVVLASMAVLPTVFILSRLMRTLG